MASAANNPPSFSLSRRWSIGLNVIVASLAVLTLVAGVNYLAARHYWRFHWFDHTRQQLSPLSARVLGALTNDIKITVLFNTQEPLYPYVSALLNEYRHASPRVTVETVDYLRDPAAAQLVKAQYKLTGLTDKDVVIFDGNGKTRLVYQNELSEYDYSELLAGRSKEVKRVAFKGEMFFTAAIVQITDPRQPRAYYLQGHGEHNALNDSHELGYAKFLRVLQEKNIAVQPLSLLGTNEVPADCQLLVIAGPEDRLAPLETERIERYLQQGGKLFVLFAPLSQFTGLERMLANWGIEVGNDALMDKVNTTGGFDLLTTRFGSHPITKPLYDFRLHCVLPRSVQKSRAAPQTADAPKVEELVTTEDSAFAVADIRGRVPYPNPARDRRGPISFAVAVEKGGLQGVTADRGATRMVVVGESQFLGNQLIESQANRDFASLAVNWLLDRPWLMGGLGPRPLHEYKLNLPRSQVRKLQWIFLAAIPGAVLLLGFLVWLRRRH
jgi:ABC-type uncharacterized transport system involved in gliding motility auxiliary subunit